jgi:hypothetical protein
MTVNPIRGEAEITIAGVTYQLEATMDSLARLAEALGDPPFHEIYRRLVGTSIHTSRVALRMFAISGQEGEKTLKREEAAARIVRNLALNDLANAQKAFVTLLGALTREGDDAARRDNGGNAATAVH